jgi:hypothetical protein
MLPLILGHLVNVHSRYEDIGGHSSVFMGSQSYTRFAFAVVKLFIPACLVSGFNEGFACFTPYRRIMPYKRMHALPARWRLFLLIIPESRAISNSSLEWSQPKF